MKKLLYMLVDLLAESRGKRQYDFEARANHTLEQAEVVLKSASKDIWVVFNSPRYASFASLIKAFESEQEAYTFCNNAKALDDSVMLSVEKMSLMI